MGRTITLYHGTDARIVYMPKDDRYKYLSMVDHVIDRLWSVFKLYYLESIPESDIRNGQVICFYIKAIEQYKDRFIKVGQENAYFNLLEKLSMLECRYNGSGFFQYGSLYLAATETTARKYAYRSFAGGELGLIAYRLIEAMSILQLPEWQPDSEIKEEIKQIMDFSNEEKADPVLVTIDDIDSDNLLSETGDAPSFFFEMLDKFGVVSDCKFRYKGNLDLSLYHIEHLRIE